MSNTHFIWSQNVPVIDQNLKLEQKKYWGLQRLNP